MRSLAILAALVIAVATACSPRETAEPSPSPTDSATAAPTATAAGTAPPSPTAVKTPTPKPPTATPTATAIPSVVFTSDSDITERERALVQLGVLIGEEYANEQFGGGSRRTVFVHIAHAGVCISGASAIGYEICVNAASDSWVALSPDYLKLKILAHEYFHVLQHDLFCYREPKWLFEGLAEWYGYEAIIDAGLVDRIAASTERQVELQDSPIHEPLSEQEILYAAPTRPQYALWSFAAQRLMAGNSDEEVRAFCAGRRDDLTWKESFADAFGQTVEEFYEEFEVWRDGFLPYSAVE
ncbi:MAG: hypothetical protein KC482_18040 [Dehalococcoidia bacterium]|nr:hypothetical protein [Dehalococcoidia bacterium]